MEPAPYAARCSRWVPGGASRCPPHAAPQWPAGRRLLQAYELYRRAALQANPLAGDFGLLSSEQHNEYYKLLNL